MPPSALRASTMPWSEYLQSEGWATELAAMSSVSKPHQIRATDAAAAALCALCFHWDDPEDVIVAAVNYGGDTGTTACMAGEKRW